MPNIRTYVSPVDQLQPEETGAIAMARAGNTIRQDYNEAGQQLKGATHEFAAGLKELGGVVEQHQTQREISQGAASYATMFSNLNDQWNDTVKNSDPNDPNVAKAFHDTVVGPAIEQFQNAFVTKGGKNWAIEHSSALGLHMVEKMAADMSTQSALAIHKNMATFENQTTNLVQSDPSSHDLVKSQIDSTVEAMIQSAGPNLKAADMARVRDELTTHLKRKVDESAFYGVVNNSPALAEKMLKEGKFPDLDGTEAGKYLAMAKRQDLAEARAARMEARLAAQEASENALKGYIRQLGTPDGQTPLQGADRVTQLRAMINKIWQDPRLKPSAAMEGTRYLDTEIRSIESGEKIITAPEVDKDFRERLPLDQDDPHALTVQDIVAQAAAKRLSTNDLHFYEQQLSIMANNPQLRQEARVQNEQLAGFKHFVTDSNPMQGKLDPIGEARWVQVVRDRTQYWQEQRKAGTSVRELTDQNSPKFWLRGVEAYAPTPQESTQGLIQGATTGKKPLPPVLWKPGESMTEYLDRINKGQPAATAKPTPRPPIEPINPSTRGQ